MLLRMFSKMRMFFQSSSRAIQHKVPTVIENQMCHCVFVLDLADLPLVKFDFSCNKVSTIPVCYRKMTQLQSLHLENNPLQSPPAQVTHTRQLFISQMSHS